MPDAIEVIKPLSFTEATLVLVEIQVPPEEGFNWDVSVSQTVLGPEIEIGVLGITPIFIEASSIQFSKLVKVILYVVDGGLGTTLTVELISLPALGPH